MIGMIRVTSSTAVLLIGLAWCVGCVGSAFSNDVTSCEDATGCGSGEACAFGTCVALGDPRLSEVDIEIERASVMSLAVQSMFGVSVASGSIDLAFRPVVQMTGVVVKEGTGIQAVVVAEPERRIAGRGRPTAVDTQADGSFVLSLLEGSGYRLSALPNDVLQPALRSERTVAGSTTLELELPATSVLVRGRVVAGAPDQVAPAAAMAVELIDGDGNALAGRTVTAADGTFAIAVDAFTTGRLRIAPAVDVNLPAIEVNIIQPEVGDVSLGVVTRPQRISGRVTDEAGNPQVGCDVFVQGNVGAGVLRRQLITDSDGAIEVELPAGTFRLAAVTRNDAAAQLLLGVADVVVDTSSIADVLVRVAVSATVQGRVLSAGGDAMVGTALHIERIGDRDGVLEPVLLDRPPVLDVLVSDADGAISVGVPAGRYRVTFQPPLNSGAPVQSLLLTVPELGLQRDFMLPERIALTGVVGDESGNRVPAATVRLFSRLVDERGRAIFLGEAVADGEGRIELPIPDVAASLR